jgi:hypothetical protein
MRIERLWPATDWATIRRNLRAAPVSETIKITWYKVVHDIVPINERLHRIRIACTQLCRHCDRKDTLRHRHTECGDGWHQWECTRQQIALLLRLYPRWIPEDWFLRPQFGYWPPQDHRAVLWVLANFVVFRLQQERTLTSQDYLDFLRRSKWKLYQTRNRIAQLGNCICILETSLEWKSWITRPGVNTNPRATSVMQRRPCPARRIILYLVAWAIKIMYCVSNDSDWQN